MKVVSISAGLLALILAFSLWTGRYAQQRADHCIALLQEVDDAAVRENWPQAELRLQKAYDDWVGNHSFFYTVMDHDQLDEAERYFAGAKAACRERDNEDFRLMTAQLQTQLRLLAGTQSISLKNIL